MIESCLIESLNYNSKPYNAAFLCFGLFFLYPPTIDLYEGHDKEIMRKSTQIEQQNKFLFCFVLGNQKKINKKKKKKKPQNE